MLTEKAARKKIRRMTYFIAAGLTAAAAAFFAFLSSPLAVHTVWLPICSAVTGLEMTAGSAGVSFFSKKDNLLLKDFRAVSPGGSAISIAELKCSADLPALLFGKVAVSDVFARDGHCTVIQSIAKSDDEIIRSTDDIEVGGIVLEDIEVSCRRPATLDGYDMHIDRFSLSSLRPDEKQEFSATGTFSVSPAPMRSVKAPFSVNASYVISRNFELTSIAGRMSSEKAVWSVDGKTVSLVLSGTVDAVKGDNDLTMINEVSISAADPDGSGVAGMMFSGQLDGNDGSISGAAAVSSHNLTLVMLPEIFGVRVSAEDGEFDYSADVKMKDGVLEWAGSGRAAAKRIFFGGKEHSVSGVEASFGSHGALDFLNDVLRISDTHLALSAGGEKKVSFRLSRDCVCLEKKASGMNVYSGENGSGTPSIEMEFTGVGLSCLSPFFADTLVDGGSLSARAVFDGGSGQMTGSVDGKIKELALVLSGERTRKHDVEFNAVLSGENSGENKVYNIKNFVIKTSTSQFGTAVSSVFSGRYLPSSDVISLDGSSTLHPWAFAGLFDERGADDLRLKIEKSGLKDTECIWNVRTNYSIQDGDLALSAETRVDDLSAFDPAFSGKSLVTRLSGTAHTGKKGGRITVNELSVEADDLFKAKSSFLALFPERTLAFDFSAERISSPFVRSIAKSFETDSRAVRAISDQISYGNVAFSGKGTFDGRSSKLVVSDFDLDLLAAAGGKVTFNLTTPLKGSLAGGKFDDADARVVCDGFDLREINMLVPGYDPFRFLSGKVDAGFDVVLKDALREMDFTYKISAENVVCGMYDLVFDFGESRLSGGLVLSDYFSNMELVSVECVCDDGGEFGLDMTSNGFLTFTGDCHSRLDFEFTSLNSPFLRTMISNIDELVRTENFDASGHLTIGCEDGFDTVTADAKIDVKELLFTLPSGGRRPLHGTLTVSLDDFLRDTVIDDVSFTLSDANGAKVWDSTFKGTFSAIQPEKEAETFFTVRAADVEFFHLAGLAAKSLPDAAVSQLQSGIDGTPKKRSQALTIGKYYTDMAISLDGVTYTRDLNCRLDGGLSWHDGTMKFATKSGSINSSPLTLSFTADTGGNKVEPFTFEASLDELDLGKASEAVSSTVSGMEEGFSGKLVKPSLKGEVKRAVDARREQTSFVTAKGELRDVVLPRASQSDVVKVLLLPVSSIPRLISLIQDDVIRDFLKKNMGDKISVVTGGKDIVFDYGEFLLEAENGEWEVKNCRLLGPDVDVRTLPGSHFNVEKDTLDVKTETIFAAVMYPAEYTGRLSDPSMNVPYFLYFFFQDNTFRIINGTVSLITLGFLNTQEDWTRQPEKE